MSHAPSSSVHGAADGRPANRLAASTSPYLLQHAHNPVDWYPWGEEAFARARDLDRPIFLSIGYAACHWCHVMAHESFENDAIALILNEHFVSIKVDREELPDVDDLYMTVVQMLTGRGGWPMTVFLTAELKPFYGGTYFPPLDKYNIPGFGRLLHTLIRLWNDERERVLGSAEQITEHLRAAHAVNAPDSADGADGAGTDSADAAGDEGRVMALTGLAGTADDLLPILENATADLRDSFERKWGGFGGAPKFPPSAPLSLLLRQARATGDMSLVGMVTHTLDRMAGGGMYDQLGGGFSRYSVDEKWLVPHFEKMLYDNALLAAVYLEAARATGEAAYAGILTETLDYVLRDLADPAGGFHSSEDADSEGEEGKFYVWSVAEIDALLDPDTANLFKAWYGVTPEGNFEGHNILHVNVAAPVVADRFGLTPAEFDARLALGRAKLFTARTHRIRPGLDDKVLTAWNGLMLSALAGGGQYLAQPRYLAAAERAADFLLTTMRPGGDLLRAYRRGHAHLPGYLEDYAFLAAGLIDLYEATFAVRWLDAACELTERMLALFWDEAEGCLYFTSAAHQHLIVRPRPSYDGATPSGNSIATLNLLRLARYFDRADFQAHADRLLGQALPHLRQTPRAYMPMLLALDFQCRQPVEVALIGDPDDAGFAALAAVLATTYVPRLLVAAGNPSAPGFAALAARLPLLTGKTLVDGRSAAYICRHYTCSAPITDPVAFAAALKAAVES